MHCVSALMQEEQTQFVYYESRAELAENYMDRWIVSFTQSLVMFVRQEMQGYLWSVLTGVLGTAGLALEVLLSFCLFLLPRASLFILCLFLLFLVYFLLFVSSCQYQCKWLPGKTRLRNDLLCVQWDITFVLLL